MLHNGPALLTLFTSLVCLPSGFNGANQVHSTSRCGWYRHKLNNLPVSSIYSPSYGTGGYRAHEFCEWTLIGQVNKHLRLSFPDFSVQWSQGCTADYVEIWDAFHGTWMGRFCGSRCPAAVTVPSYKARVRFVTDSAYHSRGFRLQYGSVNLGSAAGVECRCPGVSPPADGCVACGGVLTGLSGLLQSYSWPQNYAPNMHCTWEVQPPYGQELFFVFDDLDLEDSPACSRDYVSISTGKNKPEVLRACASVCRPRVRLPGNKGWVVFHSDGQTERTGFRLNYILVAVTDAPKQEVLCGCEQGPGCYGQDVEYVTTTIPTTTTTTTARPPTTTADDSGYFCGDLQLTGPYGVFESLNYPEPYAAPVDCRWKITGLPDQRFTMNFIEFDLDCRDTFTLFAGDFDDCSVFCYTVCSIHPGFLWNTPGNELSLYFRSLETRSNRRGFRIEYWVIGSTTTTELPTQTTPSTSSPVTSTTATTTTATTTANNPTTTPTTTTATTTPTTTTAATTTTTTSAPPASGCSVIDPYALEGVIESPNYPDPYPGNLNCTWVLSGDPVTLYFENVDVHYTSGCSGDRLMIFDGSPGDCSRFCHTVCHQFGDFPWIGYSGTVSLVLITDAADAAPGFRITYTVPEMQPTTTTTTTTTTTPAPSCPEEKLAGPSGTVTSPGYPMPSLHNVECKWTIMAAIDKALQFNIRFLEIEDDELTCGRDSLATYDGLEGDCSRDCPLYCGVHTGEQWTSTRSLVTLVYTTNSAVTSPGFVIDYEAVPGPHPSGTCGQRPLGFIYGGGEAVANSWPWQVVVYGSSGQGGVFCGGSIIAPDWVVSAAHCAIQDDYPYAVRIGAHDRFVDETFSYNVDVDAVIRHPDYDVLTFHADIVLLHLSQPVTYNVAVAPVCITGRAPPVGQLCTISGWGLTEAMVYPNELKEAEIPLFNATECAAMGYPVNEAWLCGGGMGVAGVCFGDSGGPLVCEVDGAYELVGLTSWGWVPCAQFAGVFTNVSLFAGWIHSTTQGSVPIRP